MYVVSTVFARCGRVTLLYGASWGDLGASSARPVAIFGDLGAILGDLGVLLGPLGAVLGPLGAVLGPLGAILRRSWAILAPSWGELGADKADIAKNL